MTKPCIPFFGMTLFLLAGSCTTANQRSIATPPAFQVFMLPREAGIQFETLELSDGRFHYSFTTDVRLVNDRDRDEHPKQGTYEWKGETLVLSNGKEYKLRSIHGILTLWYPEALDNWERHHIIDPYGILLPVRDANMQKPSIDPLFTEDERKRSAEQVRKLEQNK